MIGKEARDRLKRAGSVGRKRKGGDRTERKNLREKCAGKGK